MRRSKEVESEKQTQMMRPALTPEARENQLISLAIDLAERQLREGTASSQVMTHYLKLGSTRERVERELLEGQVKLNNAKTEAIESEKRVEELYAHALEAMRSYSGHGDIQNDNQNI